MYMLEHMDVCECFF